MPVPVIQYKTTAVSSKPDASENNRRLTSRVKSMKELLVELESIVSTNCADVLKKNFEGIPLEILKRIDSSKISGKGKHLNSITGHRLFLVKV